MCRRDRRLLGQFRAASPHEHGHDQHPQPEQDQCDQARGVRGEAAVGDHEPLGHIRQAGRGSPGAQPPRKPVTSQQRNPDEDQGQAHQRVGEAVEAILDPAHGLRRGEHGRLAVSRRGHPRVHRSLQRDAVNDLKDPVGGRCGDRLRGGQPCPRRRDRRAKTHAATQGNQAADEQQRARQLAQMHRDPVAGLGMLGENE